MLDFSVSEIGLIGVVALVAIGPERLPKVARAAGIMLGRFRRYALSVKAEIDREVEQSELRELKKRMEEATREAERQIADSHREVEQVLNSPAAPDSTPAASLASTPIPPSSPEAQGSLFPDAPPSPLFAPPSQPEGVTALAAEPFGGDPFSVRSQAPRRSRAISPSRKPARKEPAGNEEAAE